LKTDPQALRADLSPVPAWAGPRQILWGLVQRRERWGLSVRGWLVALAIILLASIAWVFNVQPFLAQTHRVDSSILVVEGWVHAYAIEAAVKQFYDGHYEKVFTTGGPVVGTGGYSNDFNTSASVGAELLVKAGMPAEFVQMVPSNVSGRDRTYSSAVALREWFHQHQPKITGFNVLTEDVHARRTRLLFQEAFGRDVHIGIIAVPSPEYDPIHWWRYSEGVREVLGESIAYFYAKFFFWPETTEH
jgi:uncharacterized SAM-binding protein YcdF (DUF218 family)